MTSNYLPKCVIRDLRIFHTALVNPKIVQKKKTLKNVNIIWSNLFNFFSSRTTVFLASILPDLLTFEMKQHMLHIYVVRTLNISRIYELFKGKLIPVRNAFFIGQKNVSKNRWKILLSWIASEFTTSQICVPVQRTTRKCPK